MLPFTFTDAAADWARFQAEALRWKPAGYDAEMALRLAYYLDQQLPDLKATLAEKFKETHQTITPITVPLVKHFIREQAKVFLTTTKLELDIDDAEEVGGEEPEVDPALVSWWEKTKRSMGLGLRLKRVDAYTTLFRTAALHIGRVKGRLTARVVFPQSVMAVLDPKVPLDIDQAHLVAMEIASEGGLQSSDVRRWECWCARPGEELHVIVEAGKSGVRVVDQDQGDPLRGPDGQAIVPLVFFTGHTEELGLFTMEGLDLVPANRALSVLATDLHHIAEQQGFGVMVVTAGPGQEAPPKMVRAPNTAISLSEGTDAKFINPAAPIADLIALFGSRMKQEAVLKGIPAGAVSIEARGVASGVALQIENRPLHELRSDAIEVYQEPMQRVWSVLWAVHNAFAAEEGWTPIPANVRLRWTPGDIQAPTSDVERVDTVLAKLKSRLISRVEAIAQDRGISVEEARKVAAQIDAETPAAPNPLGADPLGLAAKKQALQQDPKPPAEPADPTPP